MLYNKGIKKSEPQRWLAAIGFWWKLIRPYPSADDTDGHNIYEEVILGRDGFFRAVKLLKDAADM